MRFEVPQFIDIEDKIFGPLTIKQFIYIAGGAGLSFALYTLLPFFLAIIFIIPAMALGVALAFYQPQGRPFINVLESAFKYFLGGKLYVWKKEPKKIKEKQEKNLAPEIYIPKLSDSKLTDLSWSLDIKDRLEDNIGNN